ncbi:hypothetical protein OK016_04005 [Vibrio chagasii]|nr:hypothetical protein [Vibrio chagasii]
MGATKFLLCFCDSSCSNQASARIARAFRHNRYRDLYLIKSLDTALIAFCTLHLFSRCVHFIYLDKSHAAKSDQQVNKSKVLSWKKTPNIYKLKNILAEVDIILREIFGACARQLRQHWVGQAGSSSIQAVTEYRP